MEVRSELGQASAQPHSAASLPLTAAVQAVIGCGYDAPGLWGSRARSASPRSGTFSVRSYFWQRPSRWPHSLINKVHGEIVDISRGYIDIIRIANVRHTYLSAGITLLVCPCMTSSLLSLAREGNPCLPRTALHHPGEGAFGPRCTNQFAVFPSA